MIFGIKILGGDTHTPERRIIAKEPTPIAPSSPSSPPPPKRPGFLRRHALFFFSVLLPTALAAVYFGHYATDIYVSESSYVVRSPNQQPGASSSLGALLQGAGFGGFSKAPDDVYAISEYIRSRDALNYLDEKLDLHAAWQSPDIDLFHRFDPLDRDDSREALYEYYLKRVKVGANPASAITTLSISGFTPAQVLEMNKLLLGKAEELVNILNERGRNDLIRFAENEVKLAEDKAKDAARALSDFRNTQSVVDPEKQTMLHFEQIARLQEELIRTRGQLTQLKVFAPDSPHPPALELRAQTLEAEIAAETEKITGGENSLASKAAEYQRLQLEREFADKQLAVAMSALEGARSEAQRQQLYLETIAKPSLPDDATYPKRFRGVATTFILGLVAWGILAMLLAGVREHQY
jgi:capsular polysaccharide transport system permease protein